MKRCLLLFSPPIVLVLGGLIWSLGLQGDLVVAVWLALLAVALVLSERENVRMWRERGGRLGRA